MLASGTIASIAWALPTVSGPRVWPRPALCARAVRVDVGQHVGERDHRLDRLGIAPRVGALDLAAAAVQVADDVAQIILRSDDLDLHDRLEQLDTRLLSRFAHATAGTDFERQRRGVD